MSNRWVVFCIFLAGFCFISWKHSLIGVGDALKLAGRGLIFLGIFTWLIHIFPGLKFFFFPVCQELPDSPLHESGRLKQERVRRIQQHNHNDKTSVYVETVLKPRQTSLLKQKIERNHRMSGEMWKLGQGFSVGGEENQTHDDVDETPNERSKRKRKPLQTAAQDPVQQEVPKHKKEVTPMVTARISDCLEEILAWMTELHLQLVFPVNLAVEHKITVQLGRITITPSHR
ncbi:UBX domain-containing protein 8 isoform X2 [Xyrauchen texanus]|uniref:UBX domain-containing protein 8 isoform X2 n=1 Tax=Xyrauchen texanus TaxID=154827 RepID=UPI002242C48C|nr:UBX domain-containing protein 8 isoform X2 [Xyrauchen texanus]